MSHRLRPVGLERLARLLDAGTGGSSEAVLGLSRRLIFRPDPSDPFRLPVPGGFLDTPVGVAAGPHSQMSQNIVAAWLMGARTIELKTVQTRDDIRVSKPCIAVAGEGYNCEWSQELPLEESLRQYADAWLLVHLLAARLAHPRGRPGVEFVMSVGYDLAGILAPNVQRFLDGMQEASALLEEAARAASGPFPEARGLAVPPRICRAVTLSTMHGCPPQEIERIGLYLIEERGLDTLIKLNPTLLGGGEVRRILSRTPGCEARVPDDAFEHDLRYDQALRLIEGLRSAAARRGVRFALKLTNTLETDNDRGLLPVQEPRIYMSGEPLLALGVRLAARLQRDFDGALAISYCAGADCRNVADLLACGLAPVTACTDLLRPGGYGRLRQYLDELRRGFEEAGAGTIDEWILRWGARALRTDRRSAALANLEAYAARLAEQPGGPAGAAGQALKGPRTLSGFDCVLAPGEETCPAEQAVADYMYHTARGDRAAALSVVLATNPLPRITGTVCEAGCQLRCTRSHYDEALRIRDVKRFVSEGRADPAPGSTQGGRPAVAIVGGGPSGLSCAAFLASAGVEVDVFDSAARAGGLPRRVIPRFRLPDSDIDFDVRAITAAGVRVLSSTRVDRAFFERLRREYAAVYVAVGAQEDRRLGIPGEETPGVWAALDFLERSRAGRVARIGPRTAVVGGGNSAVDAARVALRLVDDGGSVTILYRRTLREMPADREELEAARAEGASIRQLVTPVAIRPAGGRLEVDLQPMELGPAGPDGRPAAVPARQPPRTELFDTLITAIGQKPVLDFVDGDRLSSGEPGLLAGGDVARGPASIILAVADGRRAAEQILAALGRAGLGPRPRARKYPSVADQLERASRRVWAFDDPQQEASRCLFCDEICNLCVTVCPNRANLFWESAPRTFGVQRATLAAGGSVRIVGEPEWSVRQRVQVINVADWCNECGNCASFCPTGGAPYRDKPRLCLSEASFADENDAVRLVLTAGGEIGALMRTAGAEASLLPDGEVWRFEADGVAAALDRRTLAIAGITLSRPEWDSRQAAAMAYLAADLGASALGRWLAGG